MTDAHNVTSWQENDQFELSFEEGTLNAIVPHVKGLLHVDIEATVSIPVILQRTAMDSTTGRA